MSEVNNIYEITKRLSSPDSMQEDINEAIGLLARHFASKYINPMEAALSAQRQYCVAHPTREINLLTSLKPFFQNHGNIDRLIEGFNTYRIVQGLATTPVVSSQEIDDPAIHPDGIYEVDQGCIATDAQGLTEAIRWDLLLLILLLKK